MAGVREDMVGGDEGSKDLDSNAGSGADDEDRRLARSGIRSDSIRLNANSSALIVSSNVSLGSLDFGFGELG